jgi:hypothetical protein
MARSKTAAVEVRPNRERPGRSASLDPAVAALLDHIAEDLAREYVRLMESAAHEADEAGEPTSRDRREA